MLQSELTTLNHFTVQKHPPKVFYKKSVLKNFAEFTVNFLQNTFGRLLLTVADLDSNRPSVTSVSEFEPFEYHQT